MYLDGVSERQDDIELVVFLELPQPVETMFLNAKTIQNSLSSWNSLSLLDDVSVRQDDTELVVFLELPPPVQTMFLYAKAIPKSLSSSNFLSLLFKN